jgi:hypothetical protein
MYVHLYRWTPGSVNLQIHVIIKLEDIMDKRELNIDLGFKAVKIPPVRDILVVGSQLPQGKIGIMESIKFVSPDEFVMIDLNKSDIDVNSHVSAVIVHNGILKRISRDSLIQVLELNVFPHMSADEAVSVDITITMNVSNIVIQDDTI